MTKFQFDSAREAEAARAFLVTVAVGRERHFDAGEELTELVRSDNLEPVGLIQARRDKPDPATYLGSGKIEEIKTVCEKCDRKATMNLRTVDGKAVYEGDQVQIGDSEYHAVCSYHHANWGE